MISVYIDDSTRKIKFVYDTMFSHVLSFRGNLYDFDKCCLFLLSSDQYENFKYFKMRGFGVNLDHCKQIIEQFKNYISETESVKKL